MQLWTEDDEYHQLSNTTNIDDILAYADTQKLADVLADVYKRMQVGECADSAKTAYIGSRVHNYDNSGEPQFHYLLYHLKAT